MNAIPADSPEAAVRGADIVIAATSAADPVVQTGWIQPGAFVAAIGSNQGNRRELPADLLAAAGLVAVDSLEQAKIESGDLILANALNGSNIAELKDVAKAWNESQVAVFVSLGLGLEDVAAAAYVYEQAVARKVGRPLV